MFTGLIEEVGKVAKIEHHQERVGIAIEAKKTLRGLHVDESIAVNGVCLTVIKRDRRLFYVQAVEETLKKTTLGQLQTGDKVNLERPLLPTERIGGHFVLGHVDAVGIISKIRKRKSSWVFWINFPKQFVPSVVPVGSIAVNGVSLTIASVQNQLFSVSIIHHTMKFTTFRVLSQGDRVNLEFDVIGKYIERLLKTRSGKG